MKRNCIIFVSYLILIFVLTACSSDQSKGIAWRDVDSVQVGDKEFKYNIYNTSDNSKIGTSTMQVNIINENKSLDFVSIEELNIIDSEGKKIKITQESKVNTKIDNLQPQSTEINIDNNGVNITLNANYDYEEMKVKIDALVNNEKKNGESKLTDPVIDNYQLLQVIRFMPLEVGYEKLIYNVVVVSAAKTPCKIVVKEKQTITVSDEEIECYLVELRFTGQVQKCWYSVKDMELVKYVNNNSYFEIKKEDNN